MMGGMASGGIPSSSREFFGYSGFVSSVPEPCTAMLAVVACLGCSSFGRRRAQRLLSTSRS